MQDGCHGNDAVGIEVGVGQSKVVDALVHLKHGRHLDTSRPTNLAAIQQQLVHWAIELYRETAIQTDVSDNSPVTKYSYKIKFKLVLVTIESI